MAGERPWVAVPGGVLVAVRITPKGGRDAIDGIEMLADGRAVLKARVRAAPRDGEANRALVRLLAEVLAMAPREVSIAAGANARIKRVKLDGNPAALIPVLEKAAGKGMSARIIDGKAVAAELRARVAEEARRLAQARGLVPGLAVVLVGQNPASEVYVRNKSRATGEAGMRSFDHHLPDTISEAELLALIARLNGDPAVHGILVQLPLPPHIDAHNVLAALDPGKDIDGFHPLNVGRLAAGLPALAPCTPLGCIRLARTVHASLAGLDAVVVGRSNIVGKPLAQLLLAENATVTVAHSKTNDLPAVCRRADLLCAAVGKAEMIKGAWIKPGATVIDVGINRVAGQGGKTRLVGDVAFAEVREVAGAITPVPGGVGPMTIACLLLNTLRAACAAAGLPQPDL